MRFLIDMNLSPGWVDYLTRAGHRAEHWSTIGPGEAPDDELLAYAARHEQVILTQDLDFGTLLAPGVRCIEACGAWRARWVCVVGRVWLYWGWQPNSSSKPSTLV